MTSGRQGTVLMEVVVAIVVVAICGAVLLETVQSHFQYRQQLVQQVAVKRQAAMEVRREWLKVRAAEEQP